MISIAIVSLFTCTSTLTNGVSSTLIIILAITIITTMMVCCRFKTACGSYVYD